MLNEHLLLEQKRVAFEVDNSLRSGIMHTRLFVCLCISYVVGIENSTGFEPDSSYRGWCHNTTDGIPAEPTPTSFDLVRLTECVPPPNQTYSSFFTSRNFTVSKILILQDLPASSQISGSSFSDLPGSVLELRISATGLLNLTGLSVLDQIRFLYLSQVYPDSLPKKLALLSLKQLPNAPSASLLKDLEQLIIFEAVQVNFTSLPEDLFNYTVKLEVIDLGDNQLDSLPNKLFSGLKNLTTLRLSNNRFTAHALAALAPATALTQLRLDGNPLGDVLCPLDGNKTFFSTLTELELLDLTCTNATRVCATWLHDQPRLSSIILANNVVRGFSCRDLRAQLKPDCYPTINLIGNPIEDIVCSRADFNITEQVFGNLSQTNLTVGGGSMTVGVQLDQYLSCYCGVFWLRRLLPPLEAAHVVKERCTNEEACVAEPVREALEPLDQACAPEWNVTNKSDGNFTMSCKQDNSSRIENVTTLYQTVELHGCTPKESFVEFLRMQNRYVETELLLKDLPDELPARAFSCLPRTLKKLVVSASGHLVLPPRALAELQVIYLELNRVKAYEVPAGLQELTITHRGAGPLPVGALNAPNVTIEESRFTVLLRNATGLKRLRVTAPMVKLPYALELLTLELYQLCYVPSDLLKTVNNLTSFTAEWSNFTTLSETFFSYTLKLENINLSNNQLNSLPSLLFSRLLKLKTLKLNNNQLVAQGVTAALTKVPWLKTLELRENPLSDLCLTAPYQSDLVALQELAILDLSRTNISLVCSDWLFRMPKLSLLHLEGNLIKNLSCEVLHASRALTDTVPVLNLTGNPLERFVCSQKDYERAGGMPEPKQLVSLVPEVQLQCDCNAYWLERMLCARSVALRVLARYGDDTCRLDQLGCDMDDIDREINGVKCPLSELYYNFGHEHERPYELSCKTVRLTSSLQPYLPGPVRFDTVSLSACIPPPGKSYVEALRIVLNVILGDNLILADLSPDFLLSPATFACIPATLKHLVLIASNGVLVPKLGALGRLEHIRSLELTRVRPYDFPPHLESLKLEQTGFATLPIAALSVESLEIIEENITSISLSSPRLKHLSLTIPSLKTLWISEVTAEELPRMFLVKCDALEKVEFTRLRGRRLPCDLLPGGTGLKTFLAGRNNFTSVPSDLFAYSPKLEEIDLSYNQLTYLPSKLFSGLTALRTLHLQHNRLRAQALAGVAPLRALIVLRAQGNPLGDLCDTGNETSHLLSLDQLQILDLSQTEATRLCADWRDLLHLHTLDLSRNNISSLSCSDLRVRRAPTNSTPTIDLRDNALVNAICSIQEMNLAAKDPIPEQRVELQINSKFKCTCGAFHLSVALQGNSTVIFKPDFDNKCFDIFIRCVTAIMYDKRVKIPRRTTNLTN